MTDNTKKIAKEALNKELANLQDNLYRYRHFGKPTDKTGNGVTFAEVIADLEKEEAKLKSAINEL